MEIETLKNFLAVAQEENITHAAEFLHISQPSLSRQMIELSEEFGKKLFVRKDKKMMLTEDGILLRKRALEILELVSKTEQEMLEKGDKIEGNIYFASSESDMVRTIFRLCEEFCKLHPNICYRLLSGSNEAVIDTVSRGGADFGLVYGDTDPARFDSIPLPSKANWGLLCPKDSEIAKKEAIRFDELKNLPLIINQSMYKFDEFIQRTSESKLYIVGTFNMFLNAQMMVEGGLGYAIITDNLIRFEGSTLRFVPITPEFSIPMSIIWKRHQTFSTPSAAFMNELKRVLKYE